MRRDGRRSRLKPADGPPGRVGVASVTHSWGIREGSPGVGMRRSRPIRSAPFEARMVIPKSSHRTQNSLKGRHTGPGWQTQRRGRPGSRVTRETSHCQRPASCWSCPGVMPRSNRPDPDRTHPLCRGVLTEGITPAKSPSVFDGVPSNSRVRQSMPAIPCHCNTARP